MPFCERREHDEAARLECCRLLLKAGADVNAKDARGLQCLHLVSGRQLAILKYLLDNGADVNGADDLGATPLHHIFALGCTELEAYQMLLDYGADPTRKNLEGKTIGDLFVEEEAEDWWGNYSDFAENFRSIRELAIPTKPITYSNRCRSAVPIHADHSFRFMPITDSN